MDSALVSEAGDLGSIPSDRTTRPLGLACLPRIRPTAPLSAIMPCFVAFC